MYEKGSGQTVPGYPSVEEKAAEAVKEIKKKRSEKKAGDADAEAAADEG